MSDRLRRVMEARAKQPPEVLQSPLWPRQKCVVAYCPELDAKPFHDPARFPWIEELEAAFPIIREEIDALIDERTSFPKAGDAQVTGNWSTYYLLINGRAVDEHTARFPETMRAIRKIPDLAGLVSILALGPGSHVVPHYALTNMKLRVHLGLRIPDGAGIRVDTEIRRWEEGRAMVLDDSFQHEVWNANPTATRFILLADFLHPGLTEQEKQTVRQFEAAQGETAWKMYAPKPDSERVPVER